MIGKQVGRYQIGEELGRGGMAVVYKAWQPSLERYVALKVLPEYFQHDPEFLARFHREAKTAAKLNHPNIVTVYDVGEQDGIHYIAMEYLEGGSLRERLESGSMSLRGAQHILAQVADALDYAHQRGLIHRDIKPANILFTAGPQEGVGGRPKVADFGIVRPTDQTALTRTGVLMGTPEYMAPEQAEGAPADHRADSYALGVVLYQMLTGDVPFRGTTPHATLHAVIYEPPPPPREANPSLSAAVETVVLKAIAKEPEQRFQTGKALTQALRRAQTGVSVKVPREPGRKALAPPSAWLRPRTLIVAIAAVAVLLVGMMSLLLGSSDRAEIAAETATTETRAWLDESLTATAQASAHAYSTNEAIRATERALKATAEMLDARSATGTAQAWEQAQRALTAEAKQQEATRDARDATRTAEAQPTVSPIPTATPTPKPKASATPRPEPTRTPLPPSPTSKPGVKGRIAFVSERDGNLEIYVMRADGSGLTRLTTHPAVDGGPDWSPDGKRIAFVSERDGNREIYAMNANGGGLTRLTNHPAQDNDPAWSPDGTRIAFYSDRDGNREIYVMNADGSGQTNLTRHPAKDVQPDWSPDGKRIAFYSNRDGNPDLYVMDANGSGQARLAGDPSGEFTPAWSPNGQRIVFMSNRHGNREIFVMNAGGGGQVRLTNHPGHDYQPCWSPGGVRPAGIAFVSERDGNLEIYVMNADGSGLVRLTNHPAADNDPSWAP
ncbi:MAG: protein kinase [Anaerolineae bacterium]